jgi:two-component SAPR family response regulator
VGIPLNPSFSYQFAKRIRPLISAGETAAASAIWLAASGFYEQAVALYRGEFMQGSYDAWVEEQRSYYREQYLRMLESLAAVAEKKQEFVQAMALAQKILRDDPVPRRTFIA